MKIAFHIFGFLAVCYTLLNIVFSSSCMISLDSDHKWNNDGVPGKCRPDYKAGTSSRLCVKYKTAARPGKVYRDCDHVYEKFFGYNVFRWDLGTGCRTFSSPTPDNGFEEGMYCYCNTDNCNTGDLPYPPINTTAELLLCGENLPGSISCNYGSINIISATYGRLSKTICAANPMKSGNCSVDVSPVLNPICQNKTSCTFKIGNANAGSDPCPGTTKYTDVWYSCDWGI